MTCPHCDSPRVVETARIGLERCYECGDCLRRWSVSGCQLPMDLGAFDDGFRLEVI